MHNYKAPADLLGDKKILVTGAGAGIGKAAALTYARLGATVILLGKSLDKLEAVYDAIEAQGSPQPALVPLNLESATFNEYLQVAQQIDETFGELHGLLLNAAILGDITPLEFYKPELFDSVMRVNVNAQFLLVKSHLPVLRKAEHASIVFTTSSVGRKGRAHWGAYGISKFAVEGMMQTLADELENTSNIRVNCINPGATRTAMRASAYPAENPSKLQDPEDIMNLYQYLMGEDSLAVNGQSLDAQPKS